MYCRVMATFHRLPSMILPGYFGGDPSGGGGGGRGAMTFYRGVSTPRSKPLVLLYIIFDIAGTAFICLLLTNGISFPKLVFHNASLLTAEMHLFSMNNSLNHDVFLHLSHP